MVPRLGLSQLEEPKPGQVNPPDAEISTLRKNRPGSLAVRDDPIVEVVGTGTGGVGDGPHGAIQEEGSPLVEGGEPSRPFLRVSRGLDEDLFQGLREERRKDRRFLRPVANLGRSLDRATEGVDGALALREELMGRVEVAGVEGLKPLDTSDLDDPRQIPELRAQTRNPTVAMTIKATPKKLRGCDDDEPNRRGTREPPPRFAVAHAPLVELGANPKLAGPWGLPNFLDPVGRRVSTAWP